jgi:hypothetical protein
VRSALKTLQFVEKDKPITADIKTQQVIFTVTDKKKFDLDKVKDALKAKGFPKASVLAGPK